MGSPIQVCESCQTAGPIATTFGMRLWIHLGMDIMLKTICPRYPRAAWGVRGLTIQNTGKCGHNADESGNGHRFNKLAP